MDFSRSDFFGSGWVKFDHCDQLASWLAHIGPIADRLISDPEHIAKWLRCGGTWFAGVNLLPNDPEGRVGDGPPLSGMAIRFIEGLYGRLPLDCAQLSVIYPGYPKPMSSESPAAFRFRLNRDAAHVDGLLPVGPDRKRYLIEPHAWVLGIPLNASDDSPLVIWEASHEIMRHSFEARLLGVDPADWASVDLTDTYHAARKRCFETCKRVELRARPGESYLIHRFALHGVAPWNGPATRQGRIIAYFRPELAAADRSVLFASA